MAIIPLAPAESSLRSAAVDAGSAGVARLARDRFSCSVSLNQVVGWNLPAGESVKISEPFEVTPTECSN